jgi:hypothetical protein
MYILKYSLDQEETGPAAQNVSEIKKFKLFIMRPLVHTINLPTKQ